MQKLILRKPRTLFGLARRVASWYAHRMVSGAPRPLSCGIYLTNRCNLRCEMCNIWRHPDLSFMDQAVFRRIVSGLGSVGCFYLSFAGGEPLLDPQLADRIQFAKKHVTYVHTVTNGLGLTERRCAELRDAGLDEISVSLDGTAEIHDRIRGMAGAFAKSLRGLETWKATCPGIPVVVNTVITPDNLDTLMDIAVIIRDMGFGHKFQPVNDHPEFAGMDSCARRYSWTPEAVSKVQAFLADIQKWDNIANSRYYLNNIPSFLAGSTSGGLFDDECEYAYHHMEVTSDGLIHPCLTGMDWTKGFRLEGELSDLLASPEYRAVADRLRRCTGCKTNMFICNIEPRVAFPFGNFLKYSVGSRPAPNQPTAIPQRSE